MTQPRDPRPTCPPEPLEITEEEYRAAEEEYDEAVWQLMSAGEHNIRSRQMRLSKAIDAWADAQRRAASDHQTLMRDDPAYRRSVRERDYLP